MVSVQYTKSEKDRSTHSGATSRLNHLQMSCLSHHREYTVPVCRELEGRKYLQKKRVSLIFLEYIRTPDQKQDGKELFFAAPTSQNPQTYQNHIGSYSRSLLLYMTLEFNLHRSLCVYFMQFFLSVLLQQAEVVRTYVKVNILC